jgi:polar amino acid transport system substrate-binding protein
MRFGLFVFIVTMCCCVFACADVSAQAPAPTLTLLTENYPPYNIVHPLSGQVTGTSTEKVIELMHRAGQAYTLTNYPWSRALQMARNDADTCLFSTTRTAEREAKFRWVGPLVKHNIWTVFARADDQRHPTSLDAMRPYTIGAYRKAAVGDYLALKGFTTDLANYDADNPRKLLYGRFDFWATGRLLGMATLKEQGLSGKIVPIFDFHQVAMYLACNLSVPQERIDHFNRLLKKMEIDGAVAKIEANYK